MQGQSSGKNLLCKRRIVSVRVLLQEWISTHEFGFSGLPEHQPVAESGQRSITLTTICFTTLGMNGGVATSGLSRVRLKHLPQAGPLDIRRQGQLGVIEIGRISRTVASAAPISHLRQCCGWVVGA